MKDHTSEMRADFFCSLFLVFTGNNNEDFASAKSINLPPHPSRFARHLPRHGKADRFASADNRGEDNKAILFCFWFFTVCYIAYYTAIPPYCLIALPKIITFSPSIDGSADNSSLPMSGKVARGARRMRRAIDGFCVSKIFIIIPCRK